MRIDRAGAATRLVTHAVILWMVLVGIAAAVVAVLTGGLSDESGGVFFVVGLAPIVALIVLGLVVGLVVAIADEVHELRGGRR